MENCDLHRVASFRCLTLYDHYHGRRVDFCEGGKGLVYVWFI